MQQSKSKCDLNQASRRSRRPLQMIEAVQVAIVITPAPVSYSFYLAASNGQPMSNTVMVTTAATIFMGIPALRKSVK